MKVVKLFVGGNLVEEFPDCHLIADEDWIRVKTKVDSTYYESVCKFHKDSKGIVAIEVEQKDRGWK